MASLARVSLSSAPLWSSSTPESESLPASSPASSNQLCMRSTSLANFRCRRILMRSKIFFASGCRCTSSARISLSFDVGASANSTGTSAVKTGGISSSILSILDFVNACISCKRAAFASSSCLCLASSAKSLSSRSLAFFERAKVSTNMPITKLSKINDPKKDQVMKNNAAPAPLGPDIAMSISLYQFEPVRISNTDMKLSPNVLKLGRTS
mmetsp:Transcript_4144/g.13599  ORF Transcript_4144/g.13599 Transcript_4144/m.13599 type:complete len:211 (+) Transcript_4144:4689-5321(+)